MSSYMLRLQRWLSRTLGFLPPVLRNLLITLFFLCGAYLVSSILIGHTGAENMN